MSAIASNTFPARIWYYGIQLTGGRYTPYWVCIVVFIRLRIKNILVRWVFRFITSSHRKICVDEV